MFAYADHEIVRFTSSLCASHSGGVRLALLALYLVVYAVERYWDPKPPVTERREAGPASGWRTVCVEISLMAVRLVLLAAAVR